MGWWAVCRNPFVMGTLANLFQCDARKQAFACESSSRRSRRQVGAGGEGSGPDAHVWHEMMLEVGGVAPGGFPHGPPTIWVGFTHGVEGVAQRTSAPFADMPDCWQTQTPCHKCSKPPSAPALHVKVHETGPRDRGQRGFSST